MKRAAPPAFRLFYLPLDPARRLIVCLLVGIGDPRIGFRAATPVDRTGEGACLGDVEVAAVRRLVAQRHIGFASREICRLSRLSTSSKVMPDGSAVVVDPDRQRARNPAAHSPVDTRTVPLNTGEAAARRRSNVSTASSTLSAAGTSCSPAALRRSPSGRRSNKVGPPKAGLECCQSAGDGRLAQPERPPGGTHRALPGDGEEHPDIVPIHRPGTRSWRTGRRLMPRPATRNRQSVRAAMTCSFIARLNVSTSDGHS